MEVKKEDSESDSDIDTDKMIKKRDSYDSANFLSKIFITWMWKKIYWSDTRELEEDDLDLTSKWYKSGFLTEKLEREWRREIKTARYENRAPSLRWVLFITYGLSTLPAAIYNIFQIICLLAHPIILFLLLEYWSMSASTTQDLAIIYASVLIILTFMASILQQHALLRMQRVGMAMRIASSSLVYRKILRLNASTLNEQMAGNAVDLLSNDVCRFDLGMIFFHLLWLTPIIVIVLAVLIYFYMGLAGILGLITFLMLTLPIQGLLMGTSGKLHKLIAIKTDSRVKLISEILSSVQVIKMYAWEKPFTKMVALARSIELSIIAKANHMGILFVGFSLFAERGSLFIAVMAYTLFGHYIDASYVFGLCQFFAMAQLFIGLHLPVATAHFFEMLLVIKRLQSFLCLDEKQDLAIVEHCVPATYKAITKKKKKKSDETIVSLHYKNLAYFTNAGYEDSEEDVRDSKCDCSITIKDVNASWANNKSLCLKNINLKLESGQLYAVIGSVGCGKTSLLQLILRELIPKQGSVNMCGSTSYACQDGWLYFKSFRDNILFGLPYQKRRYDEVCSVCGLEEDFKQFPLGDRTPIGEQGVTLSGGQRARVTLARAVYREADIYLLDDPLSAVDAHIGRTLFEDCISDYLKGKTRLLVTHQLQYLRSTDRIIVMDEGIIQKVCGYEELASSHEFSHLRSFLQETEKEEEDSNAEDDFHKMSDIIMQEDIFIEDFNEQPQVVGDKSRRYHSIGIIWSYWTSTRCWSGLVLMIFFLLLGQVVASAADYWVALWINESAVNELKSSLNGNSTSNETQKELEPTSSYSSSWYLHIYAGIIAAVIIVVIMRGLIYTCMSTLASRVLHNLMYKRLLCGTMSFFYDNTVDCILHRFTKDIASIDELLPRLVLESKQLYLTVAGALVLNAVVQPWTVIPSMVLLVMFGTLLNGYLKGSRAINKLEGKTKSPVYTLLSSTVNGIVTIRSSDAQKRFMTEFDAAQDLHTSAWNCYIGLTVTMGFWLDMLSMVYMAAVMLIFLLLDTGESKSGDAGLVFTQSLSLLVKLQFGFRITAEMLSQLASIERITEYTKIEQEKNLEIGNQETPEDWPTQGRIELKNMSLRYGVNTPLVLKNLDVVIESGWKVGVVGRAGAGKSSLLNALFRLAEVEGEIKFDDLDTANVSLKDLRNKISIMPQEPVLFSSTIRYNLDPFKKYTDEQLWDALKSVDLEEVVPALDYVIMEGGSGFSWGQRQRFCLARVILSDNKILIVDEAAINVDLRTDAFIQSIIRSKFSKKTVLTFTQRLASVMDCDRILVLEDGHVLEYDEPQKLLGNPQGAFSLLLAETGLIV